ncbi:MAG: NAD(P)-binding domain-containing protein [Pseudomonadota bacterium]
MTSDALKIGHIGLGMMGSALAEPILAKGFSLTLWNRTAAKAAPLVAQGATLASSAAEAARQADVLVVCLLDHAATRAAVIGDEVGEALAGKALLDKTSAAGYGDQDIAAVFETLIGDKR